MNYGEIWQLGRHKLMCGDATNRDDVYKLVGSENIDLVLTDPPYGMKCQRYDGTVARFTANTIHSKPRPAKVFPFMLNDDSPDTAKKFYELIKDYDATKIIWGGQYFANFLPISGAWIFWDKLTGNNDFSDGELAWCSRGKRVRKYTHLWKGLCREGSTILNPCPKVHPTQKPVELHAQILEDFSKEGDVI
ncbi:MAG: site-specific DNA-methyltransferase, partial [Synergistaceae bacterium]|nr:site-specific DNA-methyltransferase [Synergistaceae bacterium]